MLLSLCPGKSELFLFCGVVAEQLNNQWGKKTTNLFSSKSTCMLLSSTGMIVCYMTSFSLQLMWVYEKLVYFFLCVSKAFFAFILFFFSFTFLVSDSSSSSSPLSRTESPLHLFVSPHLHSPPKPDTFVWPPAAHSFNDPGPRQEPSLCKHALWFFLSC